MKNKIIFLFLCASFTIHAQTGEKNFIDQNYIEVTGKAEMEIAPDEITMRIILNEKDFKRVSLDEIENQMLGKLRAIGVDIDKDVTVKDQASIFRTKIFSRDILLSKEFLVVVHNTTDAQRVFDEMARINISNISIVKLSHSKMEAYNRQVKINAIKAAKDKAQLLTQAIGQSIGNALYIKELYYSPNPIAQSNILVKQKTLEYEEDKGISTKSYNFENIKIQSSILCRFDLK